MGEPLPESERRILLTAEQALDMLPDCDPIEVAENDDGFTGVEYMSRDMLVAFIGLPAVLRELAGPQAAEMGYRLVLWRGPGQPFFVKTREVQ